MGVVQAVGVAGGEWGWMVDVCVGVVHGRAVGMGVCVIASVGVVQGVGCGCGCGCWQGVGVVAYVVLVVFVWMWV